MDLLTLKYFYEITKTLNISHASFNLNISQPALTKQLKNLEKEHGESLYKRTSKGIVLTEAGKLLRERTAELLYIENETKRDILNIENKITGYLNIACVNNIVRHSLSSVISSFQEENPKIKLCFRSGDMDYIKYSMRHKLSDISLGYFPPSEKRIIRTNLSIKLGVLMIKDDPLSGNAFININHLYELPLYAPKKSTIGNVLERNGIDYDDLNILLEFDDILNYYELLQKSGVYALCLKPSKTLLQTGLYDFKPLSPNISATVGIDYNRNEYNPFVNIFIEHLKNSNLLQS